MFSSVVDVDERRSLSSSVAFMRKICKMVFHSYTLRCGKGLLPYFAKILQWISARGRFSAHRIRIIARCSSLMRTENEAAILLRQHYNWSVKVKYFKVTPGDFVLLLAHKLSSAATTTSIKINHCRNFLTHNTY
jgi:hypothetical protein